MSLRSLTLSLVLGSLATLPLASAADAQESPGQPSTVEATAEPADTGLPGGADRPSELVPEPQPSATRHAGKGFPIAPVHESQTRRERTAEDIARERMRQREYQAFLAAKLNRASGKLGAGLTLTIAGGMSLIAGVVVAVVRLVNGVGGVFSYPATTTESGRDDDEDTVPIAVPVSLVCGGAVGLAVGIPLLVSGAREVRRVERMQLLRDLERKAAARPVSSIGLSVSAFAGSGAVQIQIAIAL